MRTGKATNILNSKDLQNVLIASVRKAYVNRLLIV
jgi:hypothetical protein